VTLIFDAFAFARRREGLAGATSGPEGLVVGPSGEASCEAPPADAGEEMALVVALEVVGSDIDNAPFVNIAGRYVPCGDQVPQPRSRIGVELVVVGRHPAQSPKRSMKALNQ
jgi:hypothetical protein